jgi:hypothetical protein
MTADFVKWYSAVGISIAGIDLDFQFILDDEGSGMAVSAAAEAGLCILSGTAYFNAESAWLYYLAGEPLWWEDSTVYIEGITVQTPSYCFCFSSIELTASFPFCCVEEVETSVAFSNEGFDGVTFSVAGVEVPGLAWMTLDIDLTFDDGPDGKDLAISTDVDFGGESVCIDVMFEPVFGGGTLGSGFILDGIRFYGLGLECDMGQGVTFASLSVLDWPRHYISPGGEVSPYSASAIAHQLCCETYWEMFSISSSSDACCGGAFSFDLNVYFGADGTFTWKDSPCCDGTDPIMLECGEDLHSWLFDVARIDAEFSIGLGSNFTFRGGLTLQDYVWNEQTELCDEGGLTEICVGFEVTF